MTMTEVRFHTQKAILERATDKQMAKKTADAPTTNPAPYTQPPTLFSLNMYVNEKEISVNCTFPGGQVAGSGDFKTVLPLLESVLPKLQALFEKGEK